MIIVELELLTQEVDGALVPTPDAEFFSPLAFDGAWTPGERFMDRDSDGRYDALIEYRSVEDGEGGTACVCNHPLNDIDALARGTAGFILRGLTGEESFAFGNLEDCVEASNELLESVECPAR